MVRQIVACTALLWLMARPASAKNPEQPETAPHPSTDGTFLDHAGSAMGPLWFGAEANSIFQQHPSFSSPYSGTNSLHAKSETAISGLFTVFTAFRPHRTMELIADVEMAVGSGLSSALGLAGFTNLDVVRNPTLSHEPYVARLQIHQMIPLSRDWEPNEDRGPISSFEYVPRHRLELRVGKLSTADLFDINPAGSDSHLQFMNWTVDNNGAYDYAADTRGYTYGLVVEYQGPYLEARFGEMLMPTVANGINLDWNLAKSHSENIELEIKYSRRPGWSGTLRALSFINHANMGDYQSAIDAFRNGVDATPDITLHRRQGNSKYGFGLNLIQELGGLARLFARGGANDGHAESFAYTEVDDTFEIGFDLGGRPWGRLQDGDRPGVRDQRNLRAAPRISAAGRPRLHPRRLQSAAAAAHQPQLQPRRHHRGLLQPAHLARRVRRRRCAVHRQSRLQPGSRAGVGILAARPPGILEGSDLPRRRGLRGMSPRFF